MSKIFRPRPFDSARQRVLVLEPYFGGSHEAFITGLAQYLPYDFDVLSLPARNWKWRMRLGAPYFAARLAGVEPQQYLGILCSDFVDAAALRGLLPSGMRALPIFVYFHENQFAYPVQKDDVRDLHFGLTNFTTGLAADRLAFNSRYNLETFLTGAKEVLAHCSDFQLGTATLEEMRWKSSILPPGVEVEIGRAHV